MNSAGRVTSTAVELLHAYLGATSSTGRFPAGAKAELARQVDVLLVGGHSTGELAELIDTYADSTSSPLRFADWVRGRRPAIDAWWTADE